MDHICRLQDIGLEHVDLVGAKAARLGELLRLGFPVPPGFCVTTAGCACMAAAESRPALHSELQAACAALPPFTAPPTFAVRSSATAEDMAAASAAGQYDSFLDVAADDVPARVADCCASLHSFRAEAYRREQQSGHSAAMAVLVQVMVPGRVGGVAFSHDPLSGEDYVVIEAAAGGAHLVVQGRSLPHRYRLAPDAVAAQGDDLLTGAELLRLRDLVRAIEQVFACPQDVEWCLWHDTLYVLQARPVTVRHDAAAVFTTASPADVLWTAGFLNERFPQPVSPLGWSLLQGPIEHYALRDTLHYLGVPGCDAWPLTRLYRGHPYVNVRVFQTIYKVFPRALLPEDAVRFFPRRDAEERSKVPYPRGLWDPRFLLSMLAHFVREPQNWSPLHNDRLWARFAPTYDAALQGLARQADQAAPAELPAIVADVQRWNGRLLSIHRWSLTNAEIFYSLLRRVLRAWVSPTDFGRLAHALTAGADNLSLKTNRALARLAGLAATCPLGPDDPSFRAGLDQLLASYGHRSPSLDIYHPTLADDPDQVLALIRSQPPTAEEPRIASDEQAARALVASALARCRLERLLPLRRLLVQWLAAMARRYLPLREDQRFYLQKAMALLRRIYLRVGTALCERRVMVHADDVFFLTTGEIASALTHPAAAGLETVVRARRQYFARLTRQYQVDPSASYPPFLQGDTPLFSPHEQSGSLIGVGVSPGLGRGPVFVGLSSADLASAPAGAVLVAPTVDPGWTPMMARLAALVLETGGQLSHGAVVAREYGLPTVAAVSEATRLLRTGQMVTVDGSRGIITWDAAPPGGLDT